MADVLAQFNTMLIQNNAVTSAAAAALVAPAIQAAVAPIQAQMSDLAQRIDYMESMERKNRGGGHHGDWVLEHDQRASDGG